MKKLTRSLAETLEAISTYEGDERFMSDIYDQRSPISEIPPKRLVNDMADLEKLGMVRLFRHGGTIQWFDLTADGRDYRRNRFLESAKTVGRYAFQLLVGASGGLVVLLVGRLLGQ